jgi:hypothetical protein
MMKSLIVTIAALCSIVPKVCLAAESTVANRLDKQSFELSPTATPLPALKYQFTFDAPGDRLPGNAAILYLDSVLLLGPKTRENVQQAVDARGADKEAFAKLADSLERPALFNELEIAGRRSECDWEPPYREMGAETLLPHLEPLVKGISRLLWVRAQRQVDQGQAQEAIKTIRLGYEMSDKIGREGLLVSGLVALAVDEFMDDAVVQLISRPESPNLYWALTGLPPRCSIFNQSLCGERRWPLTAMPDRAPFPVSQPLSVAEQWRALFADVKRLTADGGQDAFPDPIKSASSETLKAARSEYAAIHKLSAAQATDVDEVVALGEHYSRQYYVAYDEWHKLLRLSYPAQLIKAKEFDVWSRKMKEDHPSNPLLQASPEMEKLVMKFAVADRRLAALRTVEALRS